MDGIKSLRTLLVLKFERRGKQGRRMRLISDSLMSRGRRLQVESFIAISRCKMESFVLSQRGDMYQSKL